MSQVSASAPAWVSRKTRPERIVTEVPFTGHAQVDGGWAEDLDKMMRSRASQLLVNPQVSVLRW
jgi:hypothetical protein